MQDCATCGKTVSVLDIFSNGDCVDCYEKRMSNIPLEDISAPDFIGTIQKI